MYACLGGNRYKWDEVAEKAGVKIIVTAVELDPILAKMYQERFPNDIVVIGDAHQYLLDHHHEHDIVWTSPPCPSHSRPRFWAHSKDNPVYPDMELYQEIIFLQHHFKGKFIVENVIPYYQPLIPAQKRGRHLYWTNFNLPADLGERRFKMTQTKNEVQELSKFHDYDFTKYKGDQRIDKVARNLVDYEAGRTILETALNIQSNKTQQFKIQFDEN